MKKNRTSILVIIFLSLCLLTVCLKIDLTPNNHTASVQTEGLKEQSSDDLSSSDEDQQNQDILTLQDFDDLNYYVYAKESYINERGFADEFDYLFGKKTDNCISAEQYFEKVKIEIPPSPEIERLSDSSGESYYTVKMPNSDSKKTMVGYTHSQANQNYQVINREGTVYAVSNRDVFFNASLQHSEDPSIKLFHLGESVPFYEHVFVGDELIDKSACVLVTQVEGDKNSGWIVFLCREKAYQLTYPDGELSILGDYKFTPMVSPDGKYLAYTSLANDFQYGQSIFDDLLQSEQERIKNVTSNMGQGWYIEEIESGKTAFIEMRCEFNSPYILGWYEADIFSSLE